MENIAIDLPIAKAIFVLYSLTNDKVSSIKAQL
jgi:hypothetical protein